MTKDEQKKIMWRFILKGRCDFFPENKPIKRNLAELSWALVVAMIIRSFLFQPFIIPTGSMIPTILVGDFIFANKYTYGYTKHSFPLGIVPIKGRVFAKDPEVGDVIIFNNPKDEGKDYVKRCIGRSGDRIQMIGGYLHINGKKLDLEFVKEHIQSDEQGRSYKVKEYIETLPNGVKHPIYKIFFTTDPRDKYNNTPEFIVPEGHFFGMGDNRDNSMDSREQERVGFIPSENLMGRASVRWMSIENARWWAIWEWPWTIRYSRIGTAVH